MTANLPNGLVVTVVSDGAGSSRYSHEASSHCVKSLVELVESDGMERYLATTSDKAQQEKQWHAESLALFERTRESLIRLAARTGRMHADLHCTLMLVLQTPWGFLSANIGDGRAGYYDGAPKPLIVPLMTMQAGATYFLIKQGWDRLFRSYVTPLEDPDSLSYFFASTDGPQAYLIDQGGKGPRKGTYDDVLGGEAFYDLNKPYHPFFKGLILSLDEADCDENRDERLRRLVEEGVYEKGGEQMTLKSLIDPTLDDDKTLIVHFRTSKPA